MKSFQLSKRLFSSSQAQERDDEAASDFNNSEYFRQLGNKLRGWYSFRAVSSSFRSGPSTRVDAPVVASDPHVSLGLDLGSMPAPWRVNQGSDKKKKKKKDKKAAAGAGVARHFSTPKPQSVVIPSNARVAAATAAAAETVGRKRSDAGKQSGGGFDHGSYPSHRTLIGLMLFASTLLVITLLVVTLGGGGDGSSDEPANGAPPGGVVPPPGGVVPPPVPQVPTNSPIPAPTPSPTLRPTASPTTSRPTLSPTTAAPTASPTPFMYLNTFKVVDAVTITCANQPVCDENIVRVTAEAVVISNAATRQELKEFKGEVSYRDDPKKDKWKRGYATIYLADDKIVLEPFTETTIDVVMISDGFDLEFIGQEMLPALESCSSPEAAHFKVETDVELKSKGRILLRAPPGGAGGTLESRLPCRNP